MHQQYFKKFLLFFGVLYLFSCTNVTLKASHFIEVKEYEDNVIFIFHQYDRDEDFLYSLDKESNSIKISLPKLYQTHNKFDRSISDIHILNQNLFNKFTSKFQFLDPVNAVLSFSVDKNLTYHKTLQGENSYGLEFLKNSVKTNRATESEIVQPHLQVALQEDSETKITSFTRGKYFWIVTDKKVDIYSKKTQMLSKKENILQNPEKSIFVTRFPKINAESFYVTKDKNILNFFLQPLNNKKTNVKNIKQLNVQEIDFGYKIDMENLDFRIIEFRDPEIGDRIYAILLNDTTRYEVTSVDLEHLFQVIPSSTGIAIVVPNSSIELSQQGNSVIIKNKKLQNIKYLNESDSVNYFESIIPGVENNLDQARFLKDKSTILTKIALLKDEDSEKEFYLYKNLIYLFFKHQLYQEMIITSNFLSQTFPDLYLKDPALQMMELVSLSFIGENIKDYHIALLKDPKLKKSFYEIDLWIKYNQFICKKSPFDFDIKAFGILHQKLIKNYPDHLYFPLITALIETKLKDNKIGDLNKILKNTKKTKTLKYLIQLDYYKFLVKYHESKDSKSYLKDLKKFINQEHDLFYSVKAELESIKIMLKNEVISQSDAIPELVKMHFRWKGGKLEFDILNELANSYDKNTQKIEALRTFQYMLNMPLEFQYREHIHEKSYDLYKEIFLSEDYSKNIDEFKLVGAFYEFYRLNFSDEKGDVIVLNVVDKLIELNLLEQAVSLLEHQVRHRLSGSQKVQTGKRLAIILTRLGQYSKSNQVLKNIDLVNRELEDAFEILRLKAINFLYLKEYDQALQMIRLDSSDQALSIRKDIFFLQENFESFIMLAETQLSNLINLVNSSASKFTDAHQDLIKLAFSYNKLGYKNKIIDLQKLIKNKESNTFLLINVMLHTDGVLQYEELFNSELKNKFNDLFSKYKNMYS